MFQHEDVPPLIKHFKTMESELTSVKTWKVMVMMRTWIAGGGRTIPPNNLGISLCLCLYKTVIMMGASPWCVALVEITALLQLCSFDASWVSIQLRWNIWVTLANMMGQDHMCLSMASTDNLFMTCLVGILLPDKLQTNKACSFGQQ